MLNIIWDTQDFFWLLAVSLLCWALERLAPWRRHQNAWRDQIGQDFFWLVLNGHYAGVLIASLAAWFFLGLGDLIGGWSPPSPESVRLLAGTPLWVQFIAFLVFRDFLEWCVHNLLHRVSWLWTFHKLHHSILNLDWIGNMRFHWMEIVLYRSLTYLPLVLLGIEGKVILWVAVFSTLIGHLNHANLRISWGPLRYLLNSPRMHVWHHDLELHGTSGQNFGIVFSVWDWLFGTAYWPADLEQPDRLGFREIEAFPGGLVARLLQPFWVKGKRA